MPLSTFKTVSTLIIASSTKCVTFFIFSFLFVPYVLHKNVFFFLFFISFSPYRTFVSMFFKCSLYEFRNSQRHRDSVSSPRASARVLRFLSQPCDRRVASRGSETAAKRTRTCVTSERGFSIRYGTEFPPVYFGK